MVCKAPRKVLVLQYNPCRENLRHKGCLSRQQNIHKDETLASWMEIRAHTQVKVLNDCLETVSLSILAVKKAKTSATYRKLNIFVGGYHSTSSIKKNLHVPKQCFNAWSSLDVFLYFKATVVGLLALKLVPKSIFHLSFTFLPYFSPIFL